MENADPDPPKAPHPPRKRAQAACVGCYKRKIRCDHCDNCTLGNTPCLSRPRTKKRNRNADARSPSFVEAEVERVEIHSILPTTPPATASKHTSGEAGQGATLSIFLENLDSIGSKSTSSSTPQENIRHSVEKNNKTENEVLFSSYQFLEQEDFLTLQAEDIRYLKMKRCLYVPRRSLLDEFVRGYFQYIHPLLPVLDESEFWHLYSSPEESSGRVKRMSLFTFQAMLCASCAHVSPYVVRELGFQDIREARSAFYLRAKMLYMLHTVTDPLSKAQGAVLLTYYNSSTKHSGNVWLLAGIQNAMVHGAHLWSTQPDDESHSNSIKKRLWCSLVLRDRVMSLTGQSPLQIPLETTHQHTDVLGEEDLKEESSGSKVFDAKIKGQLAQVLYFQYQLGFIFAKLSTVLFSSKSVIRLRKFSKEHLEDTLAHIESIESALRKWTKNLKIPCEQFPDPKCMNDPLMVHWGVTHLLYFFAHVVLCNHKALLLELHPEHIGDSLLLKKKDASGKLTMALNCIIEHLKRLCMREVATHLPIDTIKCTAITLTLIALDVRLSPTMEQTESSERSVSYLLENMYLLKSRYHGIDDVVHAIKETLTSAMDKVDRLNDIAPRSWCELFLYHSRLYLNLYLRLSLSLDSALLGINYLDDGALRALAYNSKIDLPIPHTRNLRLDKSQDNYILIPASPLLYCPTPEIYDMGRNESTNVDSLTARQFGISYTTDGTTSAFEGMNGTIESYLNGDSIGNVAGFDRDTIMADGSLAADVDWANDLLEDLLSHLTKG